MDDAPLTLAQILARSADWLAARGVPDPRYEAEVLAAHALGLDRLGLILDRERPLDDTERDAIRALVRRRGSREPLHWILGHRGFHQVDLAVRPGVLVPRPDTETLVEALLARIPPQAELYVADVGCGTGAIGLALAHARPGLRVYAIDLSDAALENTRANVEALGLGSRVAVLKGDLLAPIPPHRPVDIVVSNPPYIPSATLAGLEPEVARHEPALALDGGPDGLDVYRRLLPLAARRARIGVAVEIGHDQGAAVGALFQAAGLHGVEVLRDLGRRDRVVLGTVPRAAWPVQPPRLEGPTERVLDAPPPAPLEGERQVVVEGAAAASEPALGEDGLPLPVWDADR